MIRSRWREPFFITWVGALLAIIAAAAAADGGLGSPLVALLFLPLVGAALSYPLPSMVVTAGIDLAAYLALLAFTEKIWVPGVFTFAAGLAVVGWICAWQALIRDRQRRQLAELSRTDMLTKALNRRGFEERFELELVRAKRAGTNLSLVVIDLDHFKSVNDTKGHHAGDELLRWVAQTMDEGLRASDAVGRWGGDEFALLIGHSDPDPSTVIDRMLARLAERTEACAGVATFPANGIDQEALFQHADEALYQRKHGKSRHKPKRELSWATGLATAVDERMGAAHAHSNSVSDLAAGTAYQLGWQEPALGLLRLAAELHDVGKIAVPLSILRKRGSLSDAEWDEMRKHAEAGAEIVSRVEGLDVIVPWIRHSHERVDGRGYPDQLAGEQIPLASRIILVADAFDAMTSDRTYRAAMRHEEAIAELRRHAGTQFDTRCVDALVAHLYPAQHANGNGHVQLEPAGADRSGGASRGPAVSPGT
jgi:diguanylate cyclase (GGDEF)-like protein